MINLKSLKFKNIKNNFNKIFYNGKISIFVLIHGIYKEFKAGGASFWKLILRRSSFAGIFIIL